MIRPCDGSTGGRVIAYSALSTYAVCRQALKMKVIVQVARIMSLCYNTMLARSSCCLWTVLTSLENTSGHWTLWRTNVYVTALH